MKDMIPDLDTIHIFSDGAASQFKQRFSLSSLLIHGARYRFKTVKWHFFPTAHGKGAVDGIGAVVKSYVWSDIKSKGVIVSNAHDFVNALEKCKVKSIHIKIETIEKCKHFLNNYWNDTPQFDSIKTHHCFTVDSRLPGSVICTDYSTLEELGGLVYDASESMKSMLSGICLASKLHPDDLVTVSCNGSQNYGKVLSICFDLITVSCLHNIGKNMWIWPDRKHVLDCNVSCSKCAIHNCRRIV